MALCATTALAGAVPRLCVRGARGQFGGVRAGTWCCVSLVSPSPTRVFRAACGGPSRPGVPYPRSLVRHSTRSVRSARSVQLPSGSPRVSLSCVCARALAASAPPPLGGVACAPRVVPALGAGGAAPRGPCPSACPAPVPCSVQRAWGGAVRSWFPPTWLGVVGVAAGRPRGGCLLPLRGASGVMRSPSPDCPSTGRAVGVRDPCVVGAGVRVWGPFSVPSAGTPFGGCAPRGGSVAFMCWGGGGVRRTPRLCGRGRACRAGGRSASFRPSAFPGQATKRVSLALCCPWGRGPPYHSGSYSPGFSGYDLCGVLARRRGLACSSRPPWEPAAGAGGRVALWLLSRAGGGPSPLPRGVGAGALAACGPLGGRGGGVAPRPPCSLSGRRPAVLNPGPLRVAGALPSGVRVRSGPKCRPGVEGGEGRPVDRSPGGLCRPEPPLCPP